MKKNKISTAVKIIIGAVIVIACVAAIIFIFKDAYKPDEENLNVVNEAAVMLYNSEITNKYKRKGTQTIDDEKLYVFEFTLESEYKVTFAFAEDLKDTHKLYLVENGELSLVLFPDSGEDTVDNDVEWPDEWS